MSDYLPIIVAIAIFPLAFLMTKPAFRRSWYFRAIGVGLSGYFLVNAFIETNRTLRYNSLLMAFLGGMSVIRSYREARGMIRSHI